MKTRLLNLWESIGTSFWFVPALMVVASIGLSFTMIALDRRGEHESSGVLGFLYSVGPEGARSILSTIAGSMITVAGVAFSITIVTLTLASSQFGPRLLRNFIQDTGNKIVLGTFIATFVYCLLVLRSVYAAGGDVFVPYLSVNVAIVLALANLGVLIYFIHHISTSIQADSVITAVYRDLERNMQRLFPEELGRGPGGDGEDQASQRPQDDRYRQDHRVAASRDGYVQAIDSDGLLETAVEHDLLVQLQCRPGDYVATGSPLATVKIAEPLDEGVTGLMAKSFIVGPQRTPEQDAEFEIRQLVEIAVRALSPGTNDPFTAMACIDRLGSALCYLTGRAFPSRHRYDGKGELRILAEPVTFSGFTSSSFDLIRQYGCSSAAIMIRLLEALRMIAAQTRHPEQWNAILRQAEMIQRASEESLPEPADREGVRQRYDTLREVLSERKRPGVRPDVASRSSTLP